jgi:hypothetical protein
MKPPKILEIPKADWDAIEKLTRQDAERLQDAKRDPVPSLDVYTANSDALGKILLSTATNTWRIRSRMVDRETGEPVEAISHDEVKKICRYIEAIFASLTSVGFEVKDRTGEQFDYGLPEKVITAEPQAGITRDTVLRTLKPTIYLRNQIVQQGEVEIAIPLEKSATNEI